MMRTMKSWIIAVVTVLLLLVVAKRTAAEATTTAASANHNDKNNDNRGGGLRSTKRWSSWSSSSTSSSNSAAATGSTTDTTTTTAAGASTTATTRELQENNNDDDEFTAQFVLDLATRYIAGNKQNLMNMKTIRVRTTGETFLEFESDLVPQLTKSSTYERLTVLEFANADGVGDDDGRDADNYIRRIRHDESLDGFFEAFQFFPIQNSTRVANQFNLGGQDRDMLFFFAGTLVSSQVAAMKRQQVFFNPHALLQRAHLLDPDRLFYRPGENGKHVLGIKDEVARILLVVNKRGRITRLRTKETSPLLRDTRITVTYRNWDGDLNPGNRIRFPRRCILRGIYGVLFRQDQSSVVVNPADLPEDVWDLPNGTNTSSFDAESYQYGLQTHHMEEGFRNLGFFYRQQAYQPGEELAPGVYYLESQTNSLVICYGEGVILQEAPNNNVVANRLLAGAAALCPGLPITHLLQSHYHVDHASGSRQVVASTGANFVIGSGPIRNFYVRQVFGAESIIRPDRQQEIGNPIPNIVQVPEPDGRMVVLETDEMTVTVHDTSFDPGARDAIITSVVSGGQIVIYEADMYNAAIGGTITLGGPAGLFDTLRDQGLINENCESELPMTIVPSHGFAQSLEDSIVELQEEQNTDVGCPLPPPESTRRRRRR